MTLDECGNLSVGCGKEGIKVFSPAGKYIGTIKVPYASNVTFGGKDFPRAFCHVGQVLSGRRDKGARNKTALRSPK